MATLVTPLQAGRDAVRSPQNPVVLVGLVVIVAVGLLIQHTASTRLALLFVTGTALGVVLYQSLFGFTSAFHVYGLHHVGYSNLFQHDRDLRLLHC